jgi:Ca-activated chloride channel family protein
MEALLDFHFLRPWFLLLIPAFAWLTYWLSLQSKQHTGFEQWISPELLTHISTAKQHHNITGLGYHLRRLLPYGLMGLAGLIAIVALAGPTWKQLPQPLHQSEQAMIVVLDLSPSMRAEDIKPSRIVRARLKIQDLLTQRKDGLSALVVYAGEAHTVTPLTDDNRTIINLLATLSPGLLPIPGSNIEMAMATATQLISDSGLTEGSIVLITDGIDDSALNTIKKTVNGKADVYVLGIGTEKGAPIPATTSSSNSQGNGFLRDENNQIITVKRNEDTLKAFAQGVSGYYLPLQANDSDIRFIIERIDSASKVNQQDTRQLERNMDQWEEIGPVLLLLFLPLFALAFRRGWLLVIIIGISPMMIPSPAHALTWDDLWLNKNQRAQKAYEQQQYDDAEKSFSQPQWQGSAAYKNKHFQKAIDAFSQGDQAVDHYNKGNALSYLGEYDKAIAAYDEALVKDPDFADAKKNKNIIEELKKQQEQNQSSQDGDKKNNDDNQEQKDSHEQSSSGESEQPSSKEKNEQEAPSEDSKDAKDKQETNDAEQNNNTSQDDTEPNAQKNIDENTDENTDNRDEKNTAEAPKPQDALSNLSEEEKQELEQWIRKIPDDPSGLLRRKFEYEFQKRRQLYQSGQWTLPDNNAHQRY